MIKRTYIDSNIVIILCIILYIVLCVAALQNEASEKQTLKRFASLF